MLAWGRNVDTETQSPPARGWQPRSDGRAAVTVSNVMSQIEACVPSLRRYAVGLLRSRDEADDLVHDCLVRALDKLYTRREELEVRPWLFTILHNLFVSQARRRGSRPQAESLDESHEAAHSQRASQEDGLQWRDLLRDLDRLPDEQRAVVLLVSVEDLSYAETAAVLGVPLGTVMSRLARGRERLRQYANADANPDARPALRRVK
jgi:RNA polymerase sigma-70 factor (ECF subfamily)